MTFEWNEMFNLTETGDVTNLTYFFGTLDIEMGMNHLKVFSENVDIIWFNFWNPPIESFKFIDFEKVVVASFGGGWKPYRLPKEVQNWPNFYFIGHLSYASPEKFEFGDMCFLLGSIFAERPVSFDRFQKQRDLYFLNQSFQFEVKDDEEFKIKDDERWQCKHTFLAYTLCSRLMRFCFTRFSLYAEFVVG